MNAKEELIEAMKRFYRRRRREVQHIRLDVRTAFNLIKLGADHFGSEIAAKLWTKGIVAWEEIGFLGCKVTIDWRRNGSLKLT